MNLDLSKLRQQLSQLQDRDAQQANIIKEELQKLSELILVSAQPKSETRSAERADLVAKRAAGPEMRRDRPVPWPESASPAEAGQPAKETPEGRSKAPETARESLPVALAAPAPAVFEAGRETATGEGTPQPSDGSQGASRTPRSRLLREAVPVQGDANETINLNGSGEARANKSAAGAGRARLRRGNSGWPASRSGSRPRQSSEEVRRGFARCREAAAVRA